MHNKTAINIILTMLFVLTACSHHAASTGMSNGHEGVYAWKVNWLSLDEGLKKAEAEKKPVIVDFAVHEGCHRCEFMQKHVYSNDSIVKKINQDFIPVFIDLAENLTSEEQALGEKHEFHDDCLLLFLDHKKEPIFDDEGGKMCFADQVKPEVIERYLDYVLDIYEDKT